MHQDGQNAAATERGGDTRALRIYVDLDDVLSETARALCGLARDLFGRRIAYEAVAAFDLRIAFRLDEHQYTQLMAAAHEDDFLLTLAPTPGAAATLQAWRQAGDEAQIVTGRPFRNAACSARWLAAHGFAGIPLLHVDKYGREPPVAPGAPRALTPEEFGRLPFDVAVEDAPVALDLLASGPVGHRLVFARPWNAAYPLDPPRLTRCADWMAVAESVDRLRLA